MFILVGFIIWDRRTSLSPIANRVRELEREKENLLEILRKYARQEKKLAEIRRTSGLL
jgi:hypothetical protein